MSDVKNSDTKQKLSGCVEKITYRNEMNGYTVCTVKGEKEFITVVGILPFLAEGDYAEFYGSYTVHSTYGQQFAAEAFERQVPENSAAVLKYLSSGAIKGIGPSTAKKIVEKFGKESLDIIQNSPEDLCSIRGITIEKALSFSEDYKQKFGVRDILFFLSPYDVSLEKCIKIFKALGNDAVYLIKESPYVLCQDKIGVSFEKAETIAENLEISPDNDMRIAAGIEYILKKNLNNGHTCLPRKKLLSVATKFLISDEFRIDSVMDKMIKSFDITLKVKDNIEFISLKQYAAAEEYICARLNAAKKAVESFKTVEDIEIDFIEKRLSIEFEEKQRLAIKQVFENPVALITGGPGTGKTTTLNAIIELFEHQGTYFELAAPTGRSAKRMTELTGREAKTIHRLLEATLTDDGSTYSKNEKNPLDCDVIIIDEASMIDTLLFENLLRALKLSCKIVLVGDADQLPSVSAGNVFGDILASEQFASVRLSKVFRQAQTSMIIENAHAILQGKDLDFSNTLADCFILRREYPIDACNAVLELCTDRLPNTYKINPLADIQVLCPSKKLDCGTVNLNNLLQSCLNPLRKGAPQLSYKGVYFRIGDKVMQIKNNYDTLWEKENGESGAGVYNGDIGVITDINLRGGIVTVKYEDRLVNYLPENMGELELAYAITVHKSQGSEFDYVILPLCEVPEKLKYRNLLYTAITRAKKMLIIVGREITAKQMIANNKKTLRYTLLKDLLDGNCFG